MALETLKDVTAINGVRVHRVTGPSSGHRFIVVNEGDNAITFKIQDGPIKEHGVNGCQVDDMLAAAKTIIEGLNRRYPCRENSVAITKLDEALMWLEARKKDRVRRGVEGFDQE